MLNRSLPVLGAFCALAFASTAWAADPLPKSSDSLSQYKQMGEWTIFSDATAEAASQSVWVPRATSCRWD